MEARGQSQVLVSVSENRKPLHRHQGLISVNLEDGAHATCTLRSHITV